MITTAFKAETSCVLLKSDKHHFECSVITLMFCTTTTRYKQV